MYHPCIRVLIDIFAGIASFEVIYDLDWLQSLLKFPSLTFNLSFVMRPLYQRRWIGAQVAHLDKAAFPNGCCCGAELPTHPEARHRWTMWHAACIGSLPEKRRAFRPALLASCTVSSLLALAIVHGRGAFTDPYAPKGGRAEACDVLLKVRVDRQLGCRRTLQRMYDRFLLLNGTHAARAVEGTHRHPVQGV